MKAENGKAAENSRKGTPRLPWLLLIGLTALFTVSLYPNLVVNRTEYRLGDIVERDIKAPRDFLIEDAEATEANRKRTVEAVLTVYDHDAELTHHLSGRVESAFGKLREIIETDTRETPPSDASPAAPSGETGGTALGDRIWANKDAFESTLGISVNNGAFKILEKEMFSPRIAELIVNILDEILENGVVANKEVLLRESEKGIALREVGADTERTVRNLRQYYGLDQAKTMVRIVGQPLVKDLNYNLINLIVDFSQRLIQPNITLNRNETEERKKTTALGIKPTLYRIKAGEMLLREGERVTEVQLLKLKALHEQEKDQRIVSKSVGAAMLVLFLLLTTYLIYFQDPARARLGSDRNLIFIATTVLAFFLLAQVSAALSGLILQTRPLSLSAEAIIFGTPLAAGAMLLCLFMGLDLAIPFATVIAVCTAVIFQDRFEFFLYFLINGTMAAYWIKGCRERKGFIVAGVKLGALNILLVTAIVVYTGSRAGIELLWEWAFAFFGGVGASIVTVGIAPIVEIIFGYTTDIKLLELANLDQPILRRLMIEAPGTYHHSVIVGTMVEAAASEIGANPLLAKVCGYYHDIGKMKKPLYFIENQVDGKNRHDKLAPSMSSLILIAHIKDGVELARENKLGQDIIDSIQQHHGTSLVSYFFERAKQRQGENAVNIDDYRYPGPRPQTKEAGLVMLADVVEAASRTLYNPTTSRIQGLVQNLINKIFSDGQLDNCELTLKDLHKIAKSFNKILHGIHHHRIEYTESPAAANGKGKNGNSDRQHAKEASDISLGDTRSGQKHLKRLGQS